MSSSQRCRLAGVLCVVRIAAMQIRSIVIPLLKWFSENSRDLPWRKTIDPYAIWVSEIMLQQTQVKTVIPYWERWMKQFPNIISLANAQEEDIIKLWEGLGYYSRVRNMHKAARNIVTKHNERFPCDLEHLLPLPGVGRYTGGAICSIAYNQPEPIVDGNVIRVLTRLLGIEESSKSKSVIDFLWSVADDLVKHAISLQKPMQRNASSFNQAMMELGALVCIPKNPLCNHCPLKERCIARKEKKVEMIPVVPKRASLTKRRFVGFVICWRNKMFVSRRPNSVVNAGFWEFPNWEVATKVEAVTISEANLSLSQAELKPLCVINHSITRYRNRLEIFLIKASRKPHLANLSGKWLSESEVKELPLTSAHRKVLNKLIF